MSTDPNSNEPTSTPNQSDEPTSMINQLDEPNVEVPVWLIEPKSRGFRLELNAVAEAEELTPEVLQSLQYTMTEIQKAQKEKSAQKPPVVQVKCPKLRRCGYYDKDPECPNLIHCACYPSPDYNKPRGPIA
jgi:hypothetical protein